MRFTGLRVNQRGQFRPAIIIILLTAALVTGVASWQALQHDFSTLDGENHRWSDYEGQWVVVNYFAEWCAPCLREIPELVEFSRTAPANTELFAVSYDPLTKDKLYALKDQYQIDLPLVVPDAELVLPMQKPPYLPATFIIGPDGQVRKTLMGEVSEALLHETLQRLQSQPL
ncbi:TlpA family protein disulfide reductase [Alteromonas sp. ASW11-19]|uniref:TlpA family protein disulfide reductase n=1 Tax=Alteromonas salexigens TaxID=2982530 RepID=A0ABT2VL70_9ALTE|nr:TlpA disulfide reductase family protein [Alteromonas salexigens]MCU7554061.1 TlpA family protein disulfide reductase [Alteromonas salexigens]